MYIQWVLLKPGMNPGQKYPFSPQLLNFLTHQANAKKSTTWFCCTVTRCYNKNDRKHHLWTRMQIMNIITCCWVWNEYTGFGKLSQIWTHVNIGSNNIKNEHRLKRNCYNMNIHSSTRMPALFLTGPNRKSLTCTLSVSLYNLISQWSSITNRNSRSLTTDITNKLMNNMYQKSK